MVDIWQVLSQNLTTTYRLAVIIPILQPRKPRHEKVSHVADRRQS